MQRYRVWMHTLPAMGRTFYDGKVDVVAEDGDAAINEAIKRASRVHGHRDFRIKLVELRD